MFGNNPPRKVTHHEDGDKLILQGDPFLTIQGEGPHAGLPATFVRFWGCHLACYFCDTDFESEPKVWAPERIRMACITAPLVVLTGGEPFRQNIAPLVIHLREYGHRVQIETAGNLWFPSRYSLADEHLPDIVVSPKTITVHPWIAKYATAWKYIVSSSTVLRDEDGLPDSDTQVRHGPRSLARPPKGTDPSTIYLQPMDEQDPERNRANLNKCLQTAYRYGYRISLQQHKIIGVP